MSGENKPFSAPPAEQTYLKHSPNPTPGCPMVRPLHFTHDGNPNLKTGWFYIDNTMSHIDH